MKKYLRIIIMGLGLISIFFALRPCPLCVGHATLESPLFTENSFYESVEKDNLPIAIAEGDLHENE
jgi:hypothetical protein